MSVAEYNLWLVMREFGYTFEQVANLTVDQFNFLFSGLIRYYGKRSQK